MIAAQTPANAAAQVAANESNLPITKLTLEQLMDIQVYSAGRRLEPWQGTPSAIYVLTSEDIRRSRVTSVPEALRLVPGVQVARVDANKWAVSIRGFNARAANKLLVLLDGRSIYDPLFSGVLWEARDVMLEDIDRIEVIRGPAGTLWGANAVNGVINIISKQASDTVGTLISAGAGSEERAFGTVRYGWQTGERQHARVYVKSLTRDTGFAPAGNAHDATLTSRAGFRWDWDNGGRDDVRVSGDYFVGDVDERNSPTQTQSVDHRNRNLVTRWTRRLSDTESLRLLFYYDHIGIDNITLGEERDTYDLEFQHTVQPKSEHQLVWGAGYRSSRDDIRNSPAFTLDPASRTANYRNIFVQDTIALVPDRWQLILGTKLEDSTYADNEWSPNIRLSWTPNAQQTWWTSAARAVRIPSRLEKDITFGGNRLGDTFDAESVYTYEFGHRRLLSSTFWFDLAYFYNEYRDLLSIESDVQFRNFTNARTYGIELATRWQATPRVRLDVSYTYLQMHLHLDSASTPLDPNAPATTEGSSPNQQLTLRAAFDATDDLELDATLRMVEELPALNVDAYIVLDLGVTWHPRQDLELSLVGQNLFERHHPEQVGTSGLAATEVQHGAYAKATWRF